MSSTALMVLAFGVAAALLVAWVVSDEAAAPETEISHTKRRLMREADRRYAVLLRNETGAVARMIGELRAQDAEDMTMFVAALGDVRDEAARHGVDLSDPLVAVALDPGAPRLLCAISVAREAMGHPAHAGAAMVWALTLRAGVNLALRQPCRDLWAQIARAFPHVRAKATNAMPAGFVPTVDLERDCAVPRGFDATPRD